MEEKEALMRATSFSAKYGKRVVMVLSARLLWQYESAASTAAFGTLQMSPLSTQIVESLLKDLF